jgi:glycosyltransferase involved in cell wall biosynthesis
MLSRLKAKPDDYVLFLDDDNLIHPNWYDQIKGVSADMVTWGQQNKDGTVRLRATGEPKIGNIDTASFMVKYKIAKQLKFTNVYEADGIFAMQAAGKSNEIEVINESISYYNYLK